MSRGKAKTKHKPVRYKMPRLPMTKRTVTTRVQFGRFGGTADAASLLDQAFTAADDGDCSRVQKTLDRAEAAGANVGLHRKQLMQDCTLDRTGLAGGIDVGSQGDWFNWRTALIAGVAVWVGSKIF